MAIVIPFPKGKAPRDLLERAPELRDPIEQAAAVLYGLGVDPAVALVAMAAGVVFVARLPKRHRRAARAILRRVYRQRARWRRRR